VTVNFVNADIEAVTRAFAAMIERQIAVDPRVKGTITVYSEQPQSVREAFQLPVGAARPGLRGGRQRRPAEGGARGRRQAADQHRVGGRGGARGDQVITQIFTLRTRTRTTWWPCCAR
jgi:general secretion pathway protein D